MLLLLVVLLLVVLVLVVVVVLVVGICEPEVSMFSSSQQPMGTDTL